MYDNLVDLIDLTRARLRHLPFRSARRGVFDVADSHEPGARARLLELLGSSATLAGQTHALSRDRWRILFTPSGRAAIPIHERRFALVVWRDPIGAADDHEEALLHVRAYAAHVGKHVIAIGMSEGARRASERHGFASIWLGCEQFFELARFSTRGRRGEKLRLAVNHARRAGLSAREVSPLDDLDVRAAIESAEREWKEARSERRTTSFLRTEPMENAHLRRYFAVSREDDARIEAFLVCAPVSRRGWYLQDLVRRPHAPRGAAELVSLAALETFARERVHFATMGIVPFFDPEGVRGNGSVGGVAATCIRYFDSTFRFSGLQRFRAKFPATSVMPVHALIWPRVLTPVAAWDLLQVLS